MLTGVKSSIPSYMTDPVRPSYPSRYPSGPRTHTRSDAMTRGAESPRTAEAAGARQNKRTVLVVDDEKDLVDLITYNLTRNGYDVLVAYNGNEALEVAQRETPDLVVLDLMLPGIDGTEVARRLKSDARTAHVPIVMLTAKG